MRQVFGSFGSADPLSLCTTGGQRKENILDRKGGGTPSCTTGPPIDLPECKIFELIRRGRNFGPFLKPLARAGTARFERVRSLLLPHFRPSKAMSLALRRPVGRVTSPTGHLGIRESRGNGFAIAVQNLKPRRFRLGAVSRRQRGFADRPPQSHWCIIVESLSRNC